MSQNEVVEKIILLDLAYIQSKLKVPKSNQAKNYKYRSVTDILEEAKPVARERDCFFTLGDSIEMVGSRIYIKGTATLINSITGDRYSESAYAREEENGPLTKEGNPILSQPQLTGSASSYARKYALSGLLALDDEKDPDAINTHEATNSTPKPTTQSPPAPPEYSQEFDDLPPLDLNDRNDPKCWDCGAELTQKTINWAKENNVPSDKLRCFPCNQTYKAAKNG